MSSPGSSHALREVMSAGSRRFQPWRRPSFLAGFTLVEILVVVAIIGILVALLFPSFGRVLERANQTACLSNLKQCAGAVLLYASEHDMTLPPASENWDYEPSEIWHSGNYDLRGYLRPYLQNTFKVWRCPSVPAPSIDDPANTRANGCYGTYFYFGGRSNPDFGVGGAPSQIVRVSTPSKLPLIQDRFEDDSALFGYWRVNHASGPLTPPLAGNPSSLSHIANGLTNGYGANIVFYDGHGAWFAQTNLQDVGSAQGSSSAQRVYSRLATATNQ